MSPEELRRCIRDIPDFPKPGILFRDVAPLLAQPEALRASVDAIAAPFARDGITQVLGTEARGFIFGTAVAIQLGAGFVPVRKPGKLPYEKISVSYELEYGSDSVEMHADALQPSDRVLVVDDLIATGGTAAATIELARRSGADLIGAAYLIELEALQGRKVLDLDRVHSVIQY